MSDWKPRDRNRSRSWTTCPPMASRLARVGITWSMRLTVTGDSRGRLFPAGQRSEWDATDHGNLSGVAAGAEPEADVEREPHPSGGATGIGHLELGDLVLPVEDG